MYHKPTPEVEAEAGVMAGVAVRIALKVTLRVDDQGPPVGLNPEGR